MYIINYVVFRLSAFYFTKSSVTPKLSAQEPIVHLLVVADESSKPLFRYAGGHASLGRHQSVRCPDSLSCKRPHNNKLKICYLPTHRRPFLFGAPPLALFQRWLSVYAMPADGTAEVSCPSYCVEGIGQERELKFRPWQLPSYSCIRPLVLALLVIGLTVSFPGRLLLGLLLLVLLSGVPQ